MIKYLALTTLSILLLTLGSCKKAPEFSGFSNIQGANSDPAGGGPGTGTGSGTGTMDPSKGKFVGYDNLGCSDRSTFKGLRSWRRLSNIEVQNTVASVFKVTSGVDYSQFPSDISLKQIFDTVMFEANFVSTARLRAYVKFAESLSSRVDPKVLFPCLNDGKTCIDSRLEALLTDAWRRPPTAEEKQDLSSTYSALIGEKFSSDQAVRFLVQAIVLSRGFLYRTELGTTPVAGVYTLTSWEVASALSYALTRKPPDETLKNLAKADGLKSSSVIKAQVLRLLAEPANYAAWQDFGGMWLEADNIILKEKQNKSFSESVKRNIATSMRQSFPDVLFGQQKTLKQLLTGDTILAGNDVSFVYDAMPSAGKLTYKEDQRSGVLGQAAFLASKAAEDAPNPISRGVYVLDRFMCVTFGNVPNQKVPDRVESQTSKERFANHSTGGCVGCHATIDQVGFAFENFDQDGKFRTMDAGKPIKIESKIPLDNITQTFTSPQAMSAAIADSQQGLECFVRQVVRYGLGRMEYAPRAIIGEAKANLFPKESATDHCQIADITMKVKAKNGDMQTAIIELFTSTGFLARTESAK